MAGISHAWSGSFESLRDYINIPAHTLDTFIRYIVDGRPMGDFCIAVMANDLMQCYARGDLSNLRALWAIATWVYNRAPDQCRGSLDAVHQWPGLRKLVTGTEEQNKQFLDEWYARAVKDTQLEGTRL